METGETGGELPTLLPPPAPPRPDEEVMRMMEPKVEMVTLVSKVLASASEGPLAGVRAGGCRAGGLWYLLSLSFTSFSSPLLSSLLN